ncbi:hypothetical protein N8J89_15900 [Crossiella sp. CA-258035]|uniref:hypothetical protein n=1 Tax=Crossiella sp. CA-258035 TaxID=2981138 RepID=UPI0024BC663F|nr:hypothetical protein [Crossiella sp. CA-258035]WHT22487.1 hypothetical protein N8J89_15900 [Crossiella sp. CA-258035]
MAKKSKAERNSTACAMAAVAVTTFALASKLLPPELAVPLFAAAAAFSVGVLAYWLRRSQRR